MCQAQWTFFFWVLRRVSPGLGLSGAHDQYKVRAAPEISELEGDVRHCIRFLGLETTEMYRLIIPTLPSKALTENSYLPPAASDGRGCIPRPVTASHHCPESDRLLPFCPCVSSFVCPSYKDTCYCMQDSPRKSRTSSSFQGP